jgi:ankyrin repeat protein
MFPGICFNSELYMEHKSDKKLEVGKYNNPAEREAAIKDLCQAAKTGDAERITQLLKSDPSLIAGDPSKKQLPLYAAIEAPNPDVFHYLLARSKEISTKQNGDILTLAEYIALCQWPLAQRINAINVLELEWLVKEKKADVNAQNYAGWTPLHLAAVNGHLNMVEWLVTKGRANIDAQDNQGRTTLHLAAAHGHLDVVKWLVTKGRADIRACDKEHLTVLYHAAAHGHLDVVKWLVKEKKADVNAQNYDDWTPLHLAAAHGRLNVVEWLVTKGHTDIDAQNKFGHTALHLAAAHGRLNVVEWLVTKGHTDIHAQNKFGHTALYHAAAHGQLEMVEWLLKNGARITEQLGNENLLQVAARHRQFGVVKLLVGEFGMSPDSITALPPGTTSIQNWRPALKLLFEMYYLRQQESLHGGITKTREKVREFSDLLLDLANIVAEYYGSPTGEEFSYTALKKHQELFNKCLEWADTPSAWRHLSQQLIGELITDTPPSVSAVHTILNNFLTKHTKEITGTPFLTVIEQFLQITEKHIAQGLGKWLFFQPPSLPPAQLQYNQDLFQTLQAKALSSDSSVAEKEFVEKILFQYPYNVGIVWEITNALFPAAKSLSVSEEFSALISQLKLAIGEYLPELHQDKTDQKPTAASSEKASSLANCPFLPRDKQILWQNEYLLRNLKALTECGDYSITSRDRGLAKQLLDKISRQYPCNFLTIQQAVQDARLGAETENVNSAFASICRATLADIKRLKPLLLVDSTEEQTSTAQSSSSATSYTTKGPTDNQFSVAGEDSSFNTDAKPLRETGKAKGVKENSNWNLSRFFGGLFSSEAKGMPRETKAMELRSLSPAGTHSSTVGTLAPRIESTQQTPQSGPGPADTDEHQPDSERPKSR